MSNRFPHVRQTEKPENNDDDSGWHRNQKSKTAGVFRSKQIEQSDSEDGRGSEFFRMRNTEVLKPGERADGRRYQIISDEKKGADDGDDFGAMAHARINAAAVRIKTADDHVVEADQRGEHAHQGDEPERCVAGDGEGEANDIGFARAPVAVKNRRRARNIDVARTLNVGCYQLIRLKRGWPRATRPLSSGVASLTTSFAL